MSAKREDPKAEFQRSRIVGVEYSTVTGFAPLRMPAKLILILGMIVALGPLAIDMYLPALPRLEAHFKADAASVQATLAAYFIGLAIGQLAYGPVSDRFGRRKPMLFGLAGFTLASIGCAIASTIEQLILWRFLQAMTGCAGMVISRATVRDWCEPQDMARVLSLLVLIMGVAPIMAPSLGALLLKTFDWPALFLTLGGFGFMATALVYVGVDESLPAARRSAHLGLRSTLVHYRHVLSHHRFLGYALSGGLAQAGMFAYISTSSFVFIQQFGLSASQFSILFGVNAFGLILASQLNRMALKKQPAQRILLRAMNAYALCALIMTTCAASGWGGLWGIAVPLWFCLSCLGFTFPNSTSAAMAPFGDRAGVASALLGTMQFAIAGLASAVVGHFGGSGPLPMALTMFTCAGGACLMLLWVRGKPDLNASDAGSTQSG